MLNITIVTAIETEPSRLTLENDLRLIKAALLYADHAKLCSAASSIWIPIIAYKDMAPDVQLARLEKLLPLIVHDDREMQLALYHIERSREALKKKNPSIEDRFYRIQAKKLVTGSQEYFKRQFAALDLEGTFRNLERAIREELLEIHDFITLDGAYLGATVLRDDVDDHIERFTAEFVHTALEAVSDGSIYPLFDDRTGEIVQSCIEADVISASPTRIAQAKQSRLAADLLERLPLFDVASIDEIIDIRRDLERHLVRFRSAIMKYAENIRTASWDKEFSAEATEIFHRDIEPAVLDIEDAVRSNSSLLALTTRKLADKSAISTSIFSFVVAQLSSLHTITNMAIAASVGVATAIYDAYKEIQKQQQALEQNQLYFYYRSSTLLSDGTYEYLK